MKNNANGTLRFSKSRGLVILLMIALLLGTFIAFSLPASADGVGDFRYTVYNDEAIITGYNGNGGDVIIPPTLGGYPVTTIGSRAFDRKDKITYIFIPDSVIEIERSAFAYCTNLKTVILGSNIRTIGEHAFAYSGLTVLHIPSSVTEIGGGFVASCENLTEIAVADDNEWYHLQGNCLIETKTNVLVQGFNNTTIPNGITTIGYAAFEGCDDIKTLTIPDTVTAIEAGAFYNCFSLTSVTIPRSVISIGSMAFGNCFGLDNIIIPDSVIRMGIKPYRYPYNEERWFGIVFVGCLNLTDIYCEAPSKPSTWWNGEGDYEYESDDWVSGCKATLHWGYKPESDPTDPVEPSLPTLGDLNGNGKIEATDYMLLKRFVLGTFTLTDEQKAASDVTGDGKINALDYAMVKRHVLGTYKIGQ
ncbi:MAG: leucine-rich repeat protein [Oscillospiraceae bacterium]|nr:leucine-rich repeat protein [Oscillospiraceae bacterium]